MLKCAKLVTVKQGDKENAVGYGFMIQSIVLLLGYVHTVAMYKKHVPIIYY